MIMYVGFFLILWNVVFVVCQSPNHYVASVVEYSPIMSFDPQTQQSAQQIMLTNLDQYDSFMQEAKRRGTQIIVFPEDGLYGAYFPTRDWAYPYLEQLPTSGFPLAICNVSAFADRPVLGRAACLALAHQMYLVLSMGDLQPCSRSSADPGCPADGRYQYNTAVAFDPLGRLVAAYHKTNLYYEPEWNPGSGQPVTFATSFGVTFGLMICFDIMNTRPQAALLADTAVTDFILPSWWVNINPQITSTQQQQAWARTFRRTLLAAGTGRGAYNSGSGIYDYQGTVLSTFYNPTSHFLSRMLTSKVPIQPVAPFVQPPAPNALPSSPALTMVQPLGPGFPGGTVQLQAQAGPLKCSATVNVAYQPPDEMYALVAQYGLYNSLFNATVCAFNRCTSPTDCTSYTVDGIATFRSLEVSSNIDASTYFAIYPMFDTDKAQLFENAVYQSSNYSTSDRGLSLAVDFEQVPRPILNFALFGIF